MKTLWPPWCCLCLVVLAGCSSSSAKTSDEVTAHKASVQPEWALDDTSPAKTASAPPIQPIPDVLDDEPKQVVAKPFPEDEVR